MNLNNFLYSGFKFNEDEDLLKLKFKMINSILVIAAVSSALFGVMHDLRINDIGPIHSKVDYAYAIFSIGLIFFLRLSKDNYKKGIHLFFIASIITFTSALVFVLHDQFRLIWFYLLVIVVFILSNSSKGMLYTFISMAIIVTCNTFIDLKLSQEAIKSATIGLIICAFLLKVYTDKVTNYENILNDNNRELKLLATTDGLTGIINRRYFDEVSKKYFETAQRYKNDISLLIMDLDYFKNVNDTYGHGVGDELLIMFVEKIKPIVRRSDIFARIGGEEFAILLFNTDAKDATAFAEKVCKEIRDISIACEKEDITITTSIGVSQNREIDGSFKDIFLRSDKALYQAKDEGRDRVYVL